MAPYSVALLGWIVVLGPGPLSLDGMFRPGIGAAALPLVGLVSRGLAGLTRHIGPFYAFLLRLWIAAGLAAIALGGVKGLTNMLPTSMATPMAMAWLPQMPGMAAGIAPWALLTLAALLALGLLTRAVALILIVLIPTGMLSWGGHFGWITLLNLPLLGLPLFYGAGVISLDHAIAAAFQRRFPRFEALSAAAVASLPHVVILGGGFGGLAAARGLRYAPCRVTLLDQRNYHLFQPLLYQVATAWLSPAEIATPLREMFRTQANVRVLLGEVTGVDPVLRQIERISRPPHRSSRIRCGALPSYTANCSNGGIGHCRLGRSSFAIDDERCEEKGGGRPNADRSGDPGQAKFAVWLHGLSDAIWPRHWGRKGVSGRNRGHRGHGSRRFNRHLPDEGCFRGDDPPIGSFRQARAVNVSSRNLCSRSKSSGTMMWSEIIRDA